MRSRSPQSEGPTIPLCIKQASWIAHFAPNPNPQALRASEATRSGSGSSLPPLGKWADALLAEAKGRSDMPSLAQPDGILMSDTVCENTFVCQPQHKVRRGEGWPG